MKNQTQSCCAAARFMLAWLVLLAASGRAEDATADRKPPTASPSTTDVARAKLAPLGRVQQFSLPDAHGQTRTPQSWQKAKAVVLLFLATDCPVSNGYAPAMTRLANEFGPRDVWFAGVHCDPDVTAAIAAKHAAEYRLSFPVLLDPQQTLVRQTGVHVTPEAVVLLPNGEVVYRGRLDDLYATPGKRRPEPTTRDLAAAIEAVLGGKRPAPAETKAFGCPLPPLETPAATDESAKPAANR